VRHRARTKVRAIERVDLVLADFVGTVQPGAADGVAFDGGDHVIEGDATREQAAGAEGADLGSQLRSAIGLLYRRFRSERPEGGLGDTALAVLSRLHKHGPQTLTELSEHDRVSPASMSQTVNRLTSTGYAVRTRDPDDRRKVLFSTTAEGNELASAARAQRNAWLDQRLRAFSAEDRAVIARATALLSSIADS
jgi:DNA-binding MarR family transcriptional regulator